MPMTRQIPRPSQKIAILVFARIVVPDARTADDAVVFIAAAGAGLKAASIRTSGHCEMGRGSEGERGAAKGCLAGDEQGIRAVPACVGRRRARTTGPPRTAAVEERKKKKKKRDPVSAKMAAASVSDGGAGLRVVGNGQDKQTRGSAGYLLEDPDADDIIHKTILVGDSGVGKTSLLVQFDQGKFQTGSFSATVGIGFTNKVVTVDDYKVKLQIWDTAGQERFRSVTHAYYRDAHALLLLYDVSNKTSFDNTRAWLGEINEYAQDDVVIMLIGNKADITQDRQVRTEDGERLSREYGVAFMETSAKTGCNVELAFMAVARCSWNNAPIARRPINR
ncbi:ras-related protein Rab-26-like isoform X4 [Dermacentor andersoni]|uniref:ras-related protein Rab-26-like isoform X4 n=1 Tax=Dermacentor andersoni TaxID=34620 RepID=UPI003B3A9A29